MKITKIIVAAALAFFAVSCEDFIDVKPQGVIDDQLANSNPDQMVTAAYSMLGNCWYNYPFNLWPYGDLASDDCLKGGSGTTDTGYHDVEIWSTLTSTRGELDELWYRLYCAISRCNRGLLAAPDSQAEVQVEILVEHERISGSQSQAEGVAFLGPLRDDAAAVVFLILGHARYPPARVDVPWPVADTRCVCLVPVLHLLTRVSLVEGPWVYSCTGMYAQPSSDSRPHFRVDGAQADVVCQVR